jgi:putative SOS response-associated peptidase YedK
VRTVAGEREGVLLRWGLIPHFAHGNPGPYSTINARVETVRTSPAYRTAWKRGQRCLIVASGYYEWQERGAARQPWYIGCADQKVFAFAGIWDRSEPPDGPAIESCAIITLPASPLMSEMRTSRQREPAILAPEDHETWLTGAPEVAFAALKSYPDELRTVWPVSRKVNSPRNNDPTLTEAIAV